MILYVRTAGLLVFLFMAQLPLAGCGGGDLKPPHEVLTELERLEGTWIRVTRTGMVYEVWKKGEQGDLKGTTWKVAGGDSALTEEMRLFIKEDSLFYGARVINQNEGKEVLFTLKATGEEYIFENPGHDFPQRIRYSFPKGDELKVVIEDMSGEQRVFFNFFRH